MKNCLEKMWIDNVDFVKYAEWNRRKNSSLDEVEEEKVAMDEICHRSRNER